MYKRDILELKKRLKKDHVTFSKMCGCYVNGEKHILVKFRETFLNLEEAELHKYLDIAKKVLSGNIGNNLLELNFPANGELSNEKQVSLLKLKSSQLKDDALLDEFYQSVIDHYEYTGNFIIILFHDTYDVMTKTTDNIKIDESEEVYEYILGAICPVSLIDPGLSYFQEENRIKARQRDWVVEAPTNGFIFPAFIDHSSDIGSLIYFTKNAKDTHPELMEDVLGCNPKETTAIQKDSFQAIIKGTLGADENHANAVFMDIQENLSNLIEEHKAMYEDVETEPIVLTHKNIQNILVESGVPEEITSEIEKSYVEYFGDDLPLAENMIDAKVLKANEQRKKEEHLLKQVKNLQTKLEQAKQINEELAILDPDSDDNQSAPAYDVILQVKPEKISQIKSQIINGQKCLVIPINENEQTTVNGLEDWI